MIPFLTHKTVEFFPEILEGRLTQPLTNSGKSRCQMQGVSWQAKLYQFNRPLYLLPGATVKILGRENLCLLVQPIRQK